MTLLITIAGRGFVLASSDTRISVRAGASYRTVDEKFNKHIVFNSGELTADLTYTGLAQWKEAGRTVRLYDVISESLSAGVKQALALGPLVAQLAVDLLERLKRPGLLERGAAPILELHIVARHAGSPYPFIGVLSTFRKDPPWATKTELQWEFELDDFKFFFAGADQPQVVIGGMDTVVRPAERERLLKAILGGANAFNASRLCSQLIEKAATRTKSISARSVAVVLPEVGFLDTDLFDRNQAGLIAFLPRMIFSNGTNWGPSEYPVDLALLVDGHLPEQSLFFKAVVQRTYKTADRRRVFGHRKGNKVPGIMGMLMLTLFGKVPDGYTDFGLSG